MSTAPLSIDTVVKWKQLIRFAMKTLQTVKSSNAALNEVSQYYFQNLKRLNDMALLPSIVGDLATQIQRSLDQAEFLLTKELQSGILISDDHARYPEIVDLSLSIYSQGAKEQRDAILGPDGHKHAEARVARGSRTVLLISDSTAVDAMKALLTSYTTGAWTSFETLAADLWEAALNVHPRDLAELRGTKTRISKLSGATKTDNAEGERDGRKSVSLQEILRHECKIHDRMGTVLRADRRFDSLSRIREAYSIAFHKNSGKIDAALQSPDLDRLSAVRNVIIHRAGKMDPEYLQKAAYLALPCGPVGHQIPIDGENMIPILAGVVKAAGALIQAVDEWVEKN